MLRNRCKTTPNNNYFITKTFLTDYILILYWSYLTIAVRLQHRLLLLTAAVRGVEGSGRMIRWWLAEGELTSWKPARWKQCLLRYPPAFLQFEQANWTDQRCSDILFTDEPRFCVWSPDNRQRVCKRGANYYFGMGTFQGGLVMESNGVFTNVRIHITVEGFILMQ